VSKSTKIISELDIWKKIIWRVLYKWT